VKKESEDGMFELNFLSLMTFFIYCTLFIFRCEPSFAQALDKITVALPGGKTIKTLVADNSKTRALGLMGYSHLKPDEGMVFIFENYETHMMWMKNMLISIDIIWLDEEKEIVDIIPSIPPCRNDPCPIYGPSAPSKYVLEISDRASSLYHLQKGLKLKFP